MSAVYLSCKQAAKSLDVSQSTIKRLCDEGILVSVRTPGGHRRIALKSVQAWQSGSGREITVVPAAKRDTTPALDHTQCCQWLLDEQRHDLHEAVQRLRHKLSVAEICDDVFGPAVVRIGWLQHTGQIDIHHALRACQRLRSFLFRLSAELEPVHATNSALGVTAYGDTADLASLFAEVTLRELGWNAESLGTDYSGKALAAAANQNGSKLVWVCYTHPQEPATLIAENHDLASQLNPSAKLAIGGGALSVTLRRQMSFSFFGDSMVHLANFAHGLTEQRAAA